MEAHRLGQLGLEDVRGSPRRLDRGGVPGMPRLHVVEPLVDREEPLSDMAISD